MLKINLSGHDCWFDKATFEQFRIYGLSVCTKPDGYKTLVFSSGPFKTRLYARVIMDAPANLEVDHVDGNSLNNSKSNLRLVNSAQNKWNTVKRKSKSGLPKGVVKHGTSYKATITRNYQTRYLGTYVTIAEAEAAYKKKAEELFGEYAVHTSRGTTE